MPAARTRRIMSSLSAMMSASSYCDEGASSPAMALAMRSIRFDTVDAGAVICASPCRCAFRLTLDLPRSVRGPVLLRAFCRLAAIFFGDVIPVTDWISLLCSAPLASWLARSYPDKMNPARTSARGSAAVTAERRGAHLRIRAVLGRCGSDLSAQRFNVHPSGPARLGDRPPRSIARHRLVVGGVRQRRDGRGRDSSEPARAGRLCGHLVVEQDRSRGGEL